MTETFFYGFAIGAVTAFFISVVFFSVKYHDLYEKYQASLEHNRTQAETITDLKANQHQVTWDDERLPTYKAMSRQHPEVVQRGQCVIRIDTLGDMPPLPPGWRKDVEDA